MNVAPAAARAGNLPLVELDPRFYKLLDAFDARFPSGAPSLLAADRLAVHGDVTFGAGVLVRGDVEIDTSEPLRIEDGAVLAR
jgi:UTP--glucose-1-phosphate uridylyltransferase